MSGTRSPFHSGEQALQARVGRRERGERAGRAMIRDHLPDQHREFFAAQPLVFVASLDERGRPWASVLMGDPGFIHSPDSRTLRVAALPAAGDPLARNLAAGAPVGLLGLEFETRRRNRVNGVVTRCDRNGFDLRVDQSFGNCPQYIQARTPLLRRPHTAGGARAESALLSERAAALVRRSDTFFIATAGPDARAGDPTQGADVSHRGGKPGFVRVGVEDGGTLLTAPDFAGNSLFSTLGNLALQPRAGLLFVDFSGSDALQLTGEAEVIWQGPELAAFSGAERLLRLRVEEGLWLENACPILWTPPAQAVQLCGTGSWEEMARG